MELIKINISGTIFNAKQSTLQRIPGSVLANLKESENFDKSSGAYFFEKNATCFHAILDAFSSKQLHVPKDVCPIKFKEELEYWQVPLDMLAPCCWRYFYNSNDDVDALKLLLSRNNAPSKVGDFGASRSSERYETTKYFALDNI